MELAQKIAHNPLPTHQLAPAPGQGEAIRKAFEILDYRIDFVSTHVREIYWMELIEGSEDECITSASFPRLPGSIFLSNKALVHIPPNRIFAAPSLYALAENIFHEAIHQHVNAQVLKGEILSDDFHSATSPKVEIAWRRDQVTRNQFWELDRSYHAACVYSGLLPLREIFAKRGIPEFELACQEGREALTYLLTHLKEHRHFFKGKALQNLERIETEPYV